MGGSNLSAADKQTGLGWVGEVFFEESLWRLKANFSQILFNSLGLKKVSVSSL